MDVKLSVIIPFHSDNNASELHSLLLKNIHFALQENAEIIIVDDQSIPPLTLSFSHPNLRIIRLEKNAGPSAARNFGARISKGEILLFCDADILLGPQTISQLVFFVVTNNADITLPSYQTNLSDFSIGLDTYAKYRNDFLGYKQSFWGKEIGVFDSFCFCCKKDFFLRHDGFCEKMTRGEDEDFGNRILQNGGRIIYIKNEKVIHLHRYNFFSFAFTQFKNAHGTAKIQLSCRFISKKRCPAIAGMSKKRSFMILLSHFCGALLPFFGIMLLLLPNFKTLLCFLLILIFFVLGQIGFILHSLKKKYLKWLSYFFLSFVVSIAFFLGALSGIIAFVYQRVFYRV